MAAGPSKQVLLGVKRICVELNRKGAGSRWSDKENIRLDKSEFIDMSLFSIGL